jgi:hypothetical protein
MALISVSRARAIAAIAAASAALGSEPDARLNRPLAVRTPDCEKPAVFHSEEWNSHALAFSITYDDGTVDAPKLTRQLAGRLGFVVWESGPSGFSARWLEPRQVAALRCIPQVKSIDFVLPIELLTGT